MRNHRQFKTKFPEAITAAEIAWLLCIDVKKQAVRWTILTDGGNQERSTR